MKYTVKQGDCISSIAAKFGHLPNTILNHPQNSNFSRENWQMEILSPGDDICIPERGKRVESCPTDAKSRFRRKAVPVYFRVQLLDDELEPRDSVEVLFEADEKSRRTSTDSDGWIEQPVSPSTEIVRISIEIDDEDLLYEFRLGALDPITEISGIQQRLANLGFFDNGVSGELDENTALSIEGFQTYYDLSPTGELDDATIEKLEEVHND